MKFTFLLITVAFLHVYAEGDAQSVSFSGKEIPIRKVFSSIEQQTGYLVVTTREAMEHVKPVTLHVQDMPLRDFLEMLLKDLPLKYTMDSKTILIAGKAAAMSYLDLARTGFPVSGRVTDANGKPLAGATIVNKKTGVSTPTNADGYFTIDATAGDILAVSYVGYTGVTARIVGKDTLEIADKQFSIAEGWIVRLDAASTELKEIIINKGYYTEKKELSTGAVSKISAEEIARQPISNGLQAMQGRMAGVYVRQENGVNGGSYSITVRGRNSLRPEGNAPLYVVDGVPYNGSSLSILYTEESTPTNGGNPLNLINPSDIESIEVLKDADATSIYGSRGANGVVLITTKKNTVGRTNANVNIRRQAGSVGHFMQLLDSRQYLEMRHEAFRNDGATPQSWNYDINGTWDTTRYTDWQQKLVGGTSNITDIQASVNGGNANTQFLLGGGLYRATTVYPGDFKYLRGSGHLRLDHTSENGKFKAGAGVNFSVENNNVPNVDLMGVALNLSPVSPALYDEQGELNWENLTWLNPLAFYIKRLYNTNTTNLLTSVTLSYEILKGLTVRMNGGYNQIGFKEDTKNPASSYAPVVQPNILRSATFGENSDRSWIVEPQVEYRRKVAGHAFEVMIGSTFQERNGESRSIYAEGFSSDALMGNIQAASYVRINRTLSSQYKYSAIFGRLNYTFREMYVLNLTGRRDGSSRFGPGRQFANFGSAGAGWIFSTTAFIQSRLPFLSYGKLRSSYGIVGSDQLPDYDYMDLYMPGERYQNGSTLVPTKLVNPYYSWEETRKFEVALELGLYKDRFMLSTAYYNNVSSSQLVGYALSAVTGRTSIRSNLPAKVGNRGLEVELSAVNVRQQHFSWRTAANISFPATLLLAYPGIEGTYYNELYTIGEVMSLKGYKSLGVDPQTGLYRFEDLDGNGSGTDYPADLQSIRKIRINFFGGIQNSFTYRSFSLDFLIQFTRQTTNGYRASAFNIPGDPTNQPVEVMKRWQKPGDVSDVQRFTQQYGSPAYILYESRDIWENRIVDGSFIRLKNASLKWQMPAAWAAKSRVKQLQAFVQGQNLFTITNFIGMDPDQGSIGGLPALRVLAAGLQITL